MSSSSASRRDRRPVSVRSADAPSRWVALPRAHAAATRWTAAGTPPDSSRTSRIGSASTAAAGVQRRDRADRVRAERAERPPSLGGRERLDETRQRRGRLLAVGEEQQGRRLGRAPGDGDDGPRQRAGRRVEVVDDEERRWLAVAGQEVLGVGALAAGQVADPAPVGVDDRRELGREARLPDPRRARHDDGPAVAVGRAPPVPPQPAQLDVAARQRHDRLELGGHRLPGAGSGDRMRHRLADGRGDPHRVDGPIDALQLLRRQRLERQARHRTRQVDEVGAGDDLAGGRRGAQPGGHVERGPAVAVADRDGLARVEPDAHRERQLGSRPRLVGQRVLELDRAAQGLARGVEDGEDLVAAELDELAVPGLDGLLRDLGERGGEA